MQLRHLVVSLSWMPVTVFAQGTGTIHGTIGDPSGAAVPGAKVTATMVERGTTRGVNSDAQGEYVFPLMPVGTYQVKVESSGFKLFVRQGITLTANQNVRVDANLEVGSQAQSVEVKADAPLVDSRSSTLGTLIDSRRVLELPINGRNIFSLTSLLPGTTQVSAPQIFTGDRNGPTVSISGSRSNENLYLFDGALYNAKFRNTGLNYPPPDALQEVKVLTNSFSAEYGRNAGSVINVVSKSGTNEIHGDAWEFLRNHNLNARNFFAPASRPKLIQNQFGATAGGPIRKDKLFIFGSYEGLRVRPASLSTGAFPLTVAERGGDFSANKKAIRDPLTGQPFSENRIPASRLDPVAQQVAAPAYMPLPNRPDGQLVTTYATPSQADSFLARMDYNRGKHTIDGRYSYSLQSGSAAGGQVPAFQFLNQNARTQSVTLGDTVSLRPNLLNQLRLSYTRFRGLAENVHRVDLADLGSDFPSFDPKQPPSLGISGRVQMGGGGADSLGVDESFQVSESISWIKDRHTIHGGFELLKLRYLYRTCYGCAGNFAFNGQITGDSAADFMLGRAANLYIQAPTAEQAGLQTNTYYYVQDDWRVHPRLMLNLGLRYELPLPWVQPHDIWGTLHVGEPSRVLPQAPLGMVFPGDPGVPRGLIQTDKNNVAPRVGFAWDLFGSGRTSLRGAYGIFYETINTDIIQNLSQPFIYQFTIPVPFSLADPFRGQTPVPTSVNRQNPLFVGLQQLFYPDPSMVSPYVQHFNLTLQRQVLQDLVLQAGYVGKVGRKLLMGLSGNPAVYRPGATLANINDRRVLTGFGDNSVISSEANSRYHGLQVEGTKRFSHRFSVQGAYTFSRSIDMASNSSLGAVVPNVFDLRTQYGLSSFHVAHIGSLSWIWDLPPLSHQNPALRAVAGGWQFNGLVLAQTGSPIDILTGTDVALSGTPNQRPNVIKDPHLPDNRPRGAKILAWFDRTAFVAPAPGQFGNVGRNALIGPSSSNTNIGLFKTFRLAPREDLRLQFRSEFFNVLNSVNLSNPATSLSAGARMGQITSAGQARVIQFALKLLY